MNTKRGKQRENDKYMESTRIGTVYLQGIDHASIPWPMVSAKGGGKYAGNTVGFYLLYNCNKEKGEKGQLYRIRGGKRNILS